MGSRAATGFGGRPFPADFQLILASRSPRRHSLLRDVGIPFVVAPSTAEEVLSGAPAAALAERNARAKVQAAVLPDGARPGAFVLGTDTVVVAGEWVMGKPSSTAEAASMLGMLAGRTHQVVSGVALARVGDGGRAQMEDARVAHAVTGVTFSALDEARIAAYLASGEWRGKAGAYAIQGLAGLWVERIEGEYSNVVGLPLCLLAELFFDHGFDVVRREWL
jgi:septum formation protein